MSGFKKPAQSQRICWETPRNIVFRVLDERTHITLELENLKPSLSRELMRTVYYTSTSGKLLDGNDVVGNDLL